MMRVSVEDRKCVSEIQSVDKSNRSEGLVLVRVLEAPVGSFRASLTYHTPRHYGITPNAVLRIAPGRAAAQAQQCVLGGGVGAAGGGAADGGRGAEIDDCAFGGLGQEEGDRGADLRIDVSMSLGSRSWD